MTEGMTEGVTQVYVFSFYKYLLNTSSELPSGVYPVFVLQKLTVYCKKLKFRFKCPQRVRTQEAVALFRPHSSGQITEFSFPDYVKPLGTSRKTPS